MSNLNDATLINPSDEHIKALLSKVAYEALSTNFNFNNLGNNFSTAEKNYLQNNFRVIDVINTSTSGFQGVLLESLDENKSPTGKIVYAIRGTDEVMDFNQDTMINTKGMARDQFIDAYNWYIEKTTPIGSVAKKIIITNEAPNDRPYLLDGSSFLGTYYFFEDFNGTNSIEYSDLSITGHSLGGHLAGLLSIVTGNYANIYNAPAYQEFVNSGNSLTYVNNLNIENTSSDFVGFIVKLFEKNVSNGNINHIYNDNYAEIIANLGQDWSASNKIYCMEDKLIYNHHSIATICDAYYAYETLKEFTNGYEAFFTKNDLTTSKEVFDNVYKAYCLYFSNSYRELDYGNSAFIQSLTSSFKLWADSIKEQGGVLMVDSFNKTASPSISGSGGDDIIYTGGANDTVNSGSGNDTVYGGDFFNNAATNDYTKNIDLGSGNDKYYGGIAHDLVNGGSGDNTVYLGGGNDTIIGGKGNDVISAGSGNNTYIYNLGDNFDTISEQGGTDKIVFGKGISFDDLSFETKSSALYIYIKGNKSQGIMINNHFSGASSQIETLEFADGTSFNLTTNGFTFTQNNSDETISATNFDDVIYGNEGNDIIYAQNGNDTIIGGKGNDTLDGGNGNNIFVWNVGDGFDTISDYYGTNKIVFGQGISFADLSFIQKSFSSELCIYVNGDTSQGLLIKNKDNNRILEFADGTTFDLLNSGLNINGTDNQETIEGTNFNDIINSGKGNDTLNGDAGNDAYVYNLGDGMDTIYDTNGSDKIVFGEGIELANLSFRRDRNGLYIYLNEEKNQGIFIDRHFYNANYKVETIQFADGTTYNLAALNLTSKPISTTQKNGTSGNDVMIGTDDPDKILASSGDDMITGGKGDDTLMGDIGDDTYIYNLGDGFDTISDTNGFDRVLFGEGISFSDLTFYYDDGLCFYIKGDASQGMKIDAIEYLEFADGTKCNTKELGYTLHLNNADNTVNTEEFRYNNKSSSDYDNTIYGYGGNDTITTSGGNDIIIGGKGDDTLNGKDGNDTYIYNSGDGFDTITDYTGNDKIVFGEGISLNNLTFSKTMDDLYIYINNDKTQGIKIYRFFYGQEYNIEKLQFADGSTFDLRSGLALTGDDADNLIKATNYNDIIYGKDGKDTIYAEDGNDTIIGEQGDDTLYGGYGNDTYIYNLGDGFDTILDVGGNDKIVFGEGITLDRLMIRKEGNDLCIYIDKDSTQGLKITSYYQNINKVENLVFADGSNINLIEYTEGTPAPELNLTYNGTDGSDTIYAKDGNDTIIGGKGNDTLNGDAGDDGYIYNLGDGFDTILDVGGNDKIVFGEGISFEDLSFEYANSYLIIYVKNDKSQGIKISNQELPENAVEILQFADGSTFNLVKNGITLTQDNFDNQLFATQHNDTIYANAGNDTIYAQDGDDIIIGGKGNDTLIGGYGNDTYIWNIGDDLDTINETNRSNKIRFGENISFANLAFEAEGDNLLIYVNGDKSQGVKILYQFSANYGKVSTLEFADGTSYKIDSLNSVLTFSQSDADDIVYGRDFDDIIYGNDGKDTLNSQAGNDIIIGGKGNDILNGGDGNDTYIYNIGDGFDTINDLAANSYDKIVFGEGISATNLTFDYDGGLIIYINGDKSQGIKIVDQFSSYSPEYIIEKLEFADGSHIDLTKNGLTYTLNDGDNKIYQNFLKNTYIGGKGNDEYYAINSSGTTAQGGNTFIYNKGDGLDTISSMIDNGKIVFGEGISFEDITFKSVENNLYIYVNDELSQGIIINSQLFANSKKITHIEFADGSTFNLTNNGFSLSGNNADEKINGSVNNDTIYGNEGNDTIKAGAGNDIISGGKGNDILNGEAGDDSYIYNLGDGFDAITESAGNDKIVFGENISYSDLTFRRESTDLVIYLNGDYSQGIRIYRHFSAAANKVDFIQFADGTTYNISTISLTDEGSLSKYPTGTNVDDVLSGGMANDTIYAQNGNDVIIGNKGNDTLDGNYGDDSYIYNLGDGFDTISDYTGNDKIVFGEGISLSDLTFETQGSDLLIYVKHDRTQGMIIKSHLSSASYQIETLEFADGSTHSIANTGLSLFHGDANDNVTGTNFADTISGGKGNDTLNGGIGNDTYVYNLGDGLDTINDYESSSTEGKNDRIIFGEGITFQDLIFKNVGNSLHIYVKGDINQGVIIQNQLMYDSYHVEYIELSDGSVYNIATSGITLVQNSTDESVQGTTGNDVIYGNGGMDNITANNGDDSLIGGKGDDNLQGGNGNDTYIYNLGDGFDTISETEGVDKIKFGDGITLDNIIFESNNGSLYLYVNADKNEGIKILNQYSYSTSSKVESLEFSDGSTLDITGGLTFRQRDCDENITTSEYDDIVNAGAGNDIVNAKAGNDIIFGDNGHDTLNGDDGNDTISGGQGNDTLNGGGGNDMLTGGVGYDILNGGYGDDTYIYKLGDGFDIISEVLGNGNDKVIFDEISITDLSVQQLGSDLIFTINNDKDSGIRINSHFGSSSYRIEKLEFSDGILDISQYSNANQLVQAMASFGASSSVTGNITAEELNIVDNLIASNYKNIA